MAQIPSQADADRATILGPPYQGLTARYVSNFATQWQVLALGLTAQGFVVGAASQVTGRAVTAILLSFVILFIGLATIVSSLKIGLFAAIDRYTLDKYEEHLLTGDYEPLRLQHSAPLSAREKSIPREFRSPGNYGGVATRFVYDRIVRLTGPTRWWVVLESVISLAGAAVPVLGIFRV